MLTYDRLVEALHYDPLTGLWTWRVNIGRVKAGDIAGRRGDYHIQIGLDGKVYMAHRLAWFYMKKRWPDRLVDHRNTDGFDNRWENLRKATHQQNSANRKADKDSSLGVKGITKTAEGNYRVRIMAAGKRKSLGTYKELGLAAKAYEAAAIELQGDFRLC